MENYIEEGKKKVDKALKVLSAPKDLKISKSGDQAGPTYMKLAKCDYVDDDYVESEYDIKAPESCISCIVNAVKLALGINRSFYETAEAAIIYEKIANMYYEELNLKQASLNYERSAKIFDREGNIDKAYNCWLKLAQIAAQSGNYEKAIEFQYNVLFNCKRDSTKSSDLLLRHAFEYGIYFLSVANFDAINNVLVFCEDIDIRHYSRDDHMLLRNLADAMEKGDKVLGARAVDRYYQDITHVEDMEYHLSRILEQVLVPQPQAIVESTDNLTNDCDLVHFQEIIDPDNEVVPGSDFVITRLKNLGTYSFSYYITKKGGNLEEFIGLHKWKDGFFYDCFLVLQEEVEQIPQMKPKALLEYLEDIIGTKKYVKKMDELLNQLKEVNERKSKAVEMVKLAENEKDNLEEVNDAENLKAEPERYFTILKTYNERVEQLNLVTEERDQLKDKYNKFGKQRLEEFMQDFKSISREVKDFYQMINQGLCEGGDVEIKLVDSLAPFSGGVTFRVRPPVKNWKNIANLSGGEKILSSLAVVLALHFYKSTDMRYANVVDDTDGLFRSGSIYVKPPPCEDPPYVRFG